MSLIECRRQVVAGLRLRRWCFIFRQRRGCRGGGPKCAAACWRLLQQQGCAFGGVHHIVRLCGAVSRASGGGERRRFAAVARLWQVRRTSCDDIGITKLRVKALHRLRSLPVILASYDAPPLHGSTVEEPIHRPCRLSLRLAG
jgi:hypothetical protein